MLSALLPHFPKLAKVGSHIKDKVELIRDQEKENGREDLALMCNMHVTALNPAPVTFPPALRLHPINGRAIVQPC